MTPAPSPLPERRAVSRQVESLDRARLAKLIAARNDAQAKLAVSDEALRSFCHAYSRAHGYLVNLTVEQVQRAMEAGNA